MSLDVYLTRKRWISYDEGKTLIEDDEEVYSANITHNLGDMAQEAGIYEALWRPYRLVDGYIETDNYDDELQFEQKQVIKAFDITNVIEKGLADMKARPDYFKKFDSPNGWGLYQNFIPFIEKYLDALKEYPDAIVSVWR